MEPPPSFDNGVTGQVYKLKKSLYKLKQSPRDWFDRFSKAMKSMGYRQSRGDHTIFIKHSKQGNLTALRVMLMTLVTRDDFDKQQQLKKDSKILVSLGTSWE